MSDPAPRPRDYHPTPGPGQDTTQRVAIGCTIGTGLALLTLIAALAILATALRGLT